jgi:Helix-loop-helix DNA-binding domain
MTGSPSTFIKGEPDEFDYNPNKNFSGFSMAQGYGNQYSATSGDMDGINPSDLTMSSSVMNNQFGSHMSNSFVGDDELLDLDIEGQNGQLNNFNGFSQNGNVQNNGLPFTGAMSMNQPSQQMFSHTPETQPITSPFVNDFNYNQYRQSMSGQAGFSQSIPTTMGIQNGYDMNGRMRKMPGMDRHPSNSRSPMTPKTPAMNGLHIGSTPDSLQHHAMLNQQLHNQARAMSHHFGRSGSAQSWEDDGSIPSPHSMHMQHPQISEIIATGKHASMPAKMENGGPLPTMQSQEAKKKRRRESHNAVERRRRDNINERISDLSKLVPQHRLEDEKVKKHISNNGPLSPSFSNSGLSPPQATSLLAGGAGKRATGNITQGLPIEEKDKGPNKGDILNGSVSWMRDLMWMLYSKLQQEEELKLYIESLGGTWPHETTANETYMRTEIVDAVEKNGVDNFHYTRGPGSGLRVPKHTTIAGEALSPSAGVSPEGGSTSGQLGGQPQFWIHQSSLKEESEEDYGMDMG